MDTRLLLVKIITLLYRNCQLDNPDPTVKDLSGNVIVALKIPDQPVLNNGTHDSVTALKDTAYWMIQSTDTTPFVKDDLLQRLRINTEGEDALYEGILSGIYSDIGQEETMIACRKIKNDLFLHMNKLKLKELLRQHHYETSFNSSKVDWRNLPRILAEEFTNLDKLMRGDVDTLHPSIVNMVNLGDVKQVDGIFTSAKDELSTKGAIRFGWQGLNRMFGETGGGRRGEMVVLSALQHNFKSGSTLNMYKHHALYNTPHMYDKTKKPAIVRMSFETSANYDTLFLYKSIKENETLTAVDLATVDVKEAAAYIAEKLGTNGYTPLLVHVNPTDFTFRDIFNFLEDRISEGYEIHHLNLDYLAMISKRGCAAGPHGADIIDLFKRVRNFIAERGIFTVTPHQMSTQAKELIRDGVNDFVKQVANKGYYADCRGLDREVDMEIYQHIVLLNGESYLTLQRGKHRKIGITNPKDLYTVYKFDKIGDIRDDVLGEDMSRIKVGAKTQADGGEVAWFDLAA